MCCYDFGPFLVWKRSVFENPGVTIDMVSWNLESTHSFPKQISNHNLPHWMFGFLPVLGLGTDAKLDNSSVYWMCEPNYKCDQGARYDLRDKVKILGVGFSSL